jgi:hypothetical protein
MGKDAKDVKMPWPNLIMYLFFFFILIVVNIYNIKFAILMLYTLNYYTPFLTLLSAAVNLTTPGASYKGIILS